jgi:hypothetical protein
MNDPFATPLTSRQTPSRPPKGGPGRRVGGTDTNFDRTRRVDPGRSHAHPVDGPAPPWDPDFNAPKTTLMMRLDLLQPQPRRHFLGIT